MNRIALCCMTFLAVAVGAKAQAECAVPCGAILCPGGDGFQGAIDASRIDGHPTFRVNRAFGSPPAGFGEGSEVRDHSWLMGVQSAKRILVLFPYSDRASVLAQRVDSSNDKLLGDCSIPLEDAVAVALSADCAGAASKKGLFPECHDTSGCTSGAGSTGLLTLMFGFAAIALRRRIALRSRALR